MTDVAVVAFPALTTLIGTAINASYFASVVDPNGTHLVDIVVESTAEFALPTGTLVNVVQSFPRYPSSINLAYAGISQLRPELAADDNNMWVMATRLNLSHNALKSIANVHFPSKVAILDVSYNALGCLGRVNPLPSVSESTALNQLYLKSNHITSLLDAEFPPGLQVLDLEDNAIDSLTNVKWPVALERLSLARNRLRSSVSARFPDTLLHLNLEANNFSILHVALPPRLKTLSLGDNPLQSLFATPLQFDRLARLDNLTLPHQNLSCNASTETRLLWNQIPICMIPDASTPESAASPSADAWIYAILGLTSACVVVIFVLLAYRAKHRRRKALAENEAAYGKLSDTAFLVKDLRIDPALRRCRIPASCLTRGALVAKGGFGVVHVATLNRSPEFVDRTVALKSLRPERVHELRAVQAFVEEIRLGASLRHDNIVGFIGITFASAQSPTAVLEYMARGDLWSVLSTDQRFVWATAENAPHTPGAIRSKEAVCCDVARGLAYLHSEVTPAVIHRDLKSKNVLLNEAYVAKLSDFGTSREFGPDDHVLTAEVGTVPWIAPEVLKGTRYSEKADIYSFGVLLSELDTHQVPYFNQIVTLPIGGINVTLTKARIAMLVAANELRPAFSRSCPPAILAIATRCLAHEPDERPTARQLLSSLSSLCLEGEDYHVV
ncbi:TKL protein kinase [Saprolegnia diclina VS20]|uniref:TKL protein kinase n=1 Tax=Saprolegnia diclina (strain VS20) TaxID=1156394 RepID=T0Q0F8_SAPDV|nr:TKL protein kinase [Saprolegnia diclina VS20]EQC31334.1 TKL protein kinase [Saprolegnia diclina VS20]|eukprot:XP_008615175.1 TKL protein kinase [Saprolegnia diclina VS20]